MSSLFKQISQLSQEAEKQRQQVAAGSSTSVSQPTLTTSEPEPVVPEILPVEPEAKSLPAGKKVVPQSGTVVPKKSDELPHLDMDKLKIIISEISQMQTGRDGLNVRMSPQEMADIEDFILITLRKQGLRGYEVSMAKLMRYAMRYMFRVHEKEFISALKQVLSTEETLSI